MLPSRPDTSSGLRAEPASSRCPVLQHLDLRPALHVGAGIRGPQVARHVAQGGHHVWSGYSAGIGRSRTYRRRTVRWLGPSTGHLQLAVRAVLRRRHRIGYAERRALHPGPATSTSAGCGRARLHGPASPYPNPNGSITLGYHSHPARGALVHVQTAIDLRHLRRRLERQPGQHGSLSVTPSGSAWATRRHSRPPSLAAGRDLRTHRRRHRGRHGHRPRTRCSSHIQAPALGTA